MNLKFQVFISSTYNDLRMARNKVYNALLSIGIMPVGMEHFPSRSVEQMEHIKEKIAESDIVITIVGNRYGSIINGGEYDGISYTEFEYRFAKQLNKPVLAFIKDDNKSIKTVDDIQKLTNFKKELKKSLVNFWTNTDNLATKVLASIINETNYPQIKDNIDLNSNIKNKYIENISELKNEFYKTGVNYSIKSLLQNCNIFNGITLTNFNTIKYFTIELENLLNCAPLLKRTNVYRYINNFNDILKIYVDYLLEISIKDNNQMLYNIDKYQRKDNVLRNKNTFITYLLLGKYDAIADLIS